MCQMTNMEHESLREGCYAISMRLGKDRFDGTLRLDLSAPGSGADDGHIVASGDLYRRHSNPPHPTGPPAIPIMPRDRYDSYLAVTGIRRSNHSASLWLAVDRYRYEAPQYGGYTGSFPSNPNQKTTIQRPPALVLASGTHDRAIDPDNARDALLRAFGKGAGAVRDELLKLHPKYSVPGVVSLELG
jgi:hypothetical protein